MVDVSREQRYTRDHPCPICGGFDQAPRGNGVRCFGFTDGEWAHCTREEHAGGIAFNVKNSAYSHVLAGLCQCGKEHGRRTMMGSAAYETVATYDYQDRDDRLLFQVVRKRNPVTGAKTFLQRRPDPAARDGWTWNLNGVDRVLYRLPELLAADPQRPVYFVEGEKDVDRLLERGLVATTNPMGAGKWVKKYGRWLRGRSVVVIPDNDDRTTQPPFAGQRHAHEVARSLVGVAASVRLLKLPDLPPKGDVSDWLDAGGTPEQLEALAASTPEYGFNSGEMGADFDDGHAGGNGSVQDNEDEPDYRDVVWQGSKHRPVAQHLIQNGLLKRGQLISAPGEAFYYFDAKTHELHRVEGSSMQAHLNEVYKINATEGLYKFLVEDMRVEALMRGTKAMIHTFSYYDSAANAMYLDTGRGQMLRIDGSNVEVVDNGTDTVLFLPQADVEPWEYVANVPEYELARVLIKGMNFTEREGATFTPEEQQLLALLWLLSIAFRSVLPTRPLALAVGDAGSGKSNFFRRVGMLLEGSDFQVDALDRDKKGQEQFFVNVTNRGFVVFDNVDQFVPWLQDALAQVVTGIKITKRVLHTTNQAASFRANAFLAMTARTPKFRREDVSERLVIFELDKLTQKLAEKQLLQEVVSRRNELMSDYANLLNKVIATPEPPSGYQSLRLADFANVATRIGAAMGQSERTAQVLKRLRLAQRLYAAEESDVRILLDSWLGLTAHDEELGQTVLNEGRAVSPTALFKELQAVAEDLHMEWKYSSHVALSRQLQLMQDALSAHFDIEHGRTMSGRWWRFSRAVQDSGGNEAL